MIKCKKDAWTYRFLISANANITHLVFLTHRGYIGIRPLRPTPKSQQRQGLQHGIALFSYVQRCHWIRPNLPSERCDHAFGERVAVHVQQLVTDNPVTPSP